MKNERSKPFLETWSWTERFNSVKITTENGRTFLNVSRPMLDQMATIVVVEIEGEDVQR